jgi:hypothetical protein
MDIDQQTLVALITTTSRTEQAITDLTTRLLGGQGQVGAIPYLANEHKSLNDRMGKVEQKQYYFGVAGAAIGGALGYLSSLFKHS